MLPMSAESSTVSVLPLKIPPPVPAPVGVPVAAVLPQTVVFVMVAVPLL